MRASILRGPAALGFLLCPVIAAAQDASPVAAATGDTAWLINATALTSMWPESGVPPI